MHALGSYWLKFVRRGASLLFARAFHLGAWLPAGALGGVISCSDVTSSRGSDCLGADRVLRVNA